MIIGKNSSWHLSVTAKGWAFWGKMDAAHQVCSMAVGIAAGGVGEGYDGNDVYANVHGLCSCSCSTALPHLSSR